MDITSAAGTTDIDARIPGTNMNVDVGVSSSGIDVDTAGIAKSGLAHVGAHIPGTGGVAGHAAGMLSNHVKGAGGLSHVASAAGVHAPSAGGLAHGAAGKLTGHIPGGSHLGTAAKFAGKALKASRAIGMSKGKVVFTMLAEKYSMGRRMTLGKVLGVKNWQKRYFELFDDAVIHYSENVCEKDAPLGIINIVPGEFTVVKHPTTADHPEAGGSANELLFIFVDKGATFELLVRPSTEVATKGCVIHLEKLGATVRDNEAANTVC